MEKKTGNKLFAAVSKVFLGMVFIALAAYLLIALSWWEHTWFLIKGSAAPFLVLAGVITLALAKE